MASKWYYQTANAEVGPISSKELLEKIRQGVIVRETLVRKGESKWIAARQVNGLFERAEAEQEHHHVCPYCGQAIAAPPTACGFCGHHVDLSMDDQEQKKVEEASKIDREEEAARAEAEAHKRDIIRYAILLLVLIVFLVAAPYAVSLASSGAMGISYAVPIASVVAAILFGVIIFFIVRT